jgi:hypothetical protein
MLANGSIEPPSEERPPALPRELGHERQQPRHRVVGVKRLGEGPNQRQPHVIIRGPGALRQPVIEPRARKGGSPCEISTIRRSSSRSVGLTALMYHAFVSTIHRRSACRTGIAKPRLGGTNGGARSKSRAGGTIARPAIDEPLQAMRHHA